MPIDIAFPTFSGHIIHLADMESKAINPPLQSAFAKNLPLTALEKGSFLRKSGCVKQTPCPVGTYDNSPAIMQIHKLIG
jgi:hypothetical protein